jgi:hypothetical protein
MHSRAAHVGPNTSLIPSDSSSPPTNASTHRKQA